MNTYSLAIMSALAILASTACCGDDETTSSATTSSAGGSAGQGGSAGGAGGTGGGETQAVCGNGMAEVELCFDNTVSSYTAGVSTVIGMELVDCDGDDDLDVLVLGKTATDNPALSVRINNGAGVLETGPTLNLASTGVLAMTFDPNSDYRGRFAVVGGSTLNIVSLGSNNCALTAHSNFSVPGLITGGVGALDLDGSEESDYVVPVKVGAGNLQTWLYRSSEGMVVQDGEFAATSVSAVVSASNTSAAPGVMLANDLQRQVLLVVKNGINGVSNGAQAPFSPAQTGNGLVDLVAGDFGKDNEPDIITANRLDSSITVMHLDKGAYTLSHPDVSIAGDGDPASFPIDIGAGDIDGDGDLDVVTANEGNGGAIGASLSVFLNLGDLVFKVAQTSAAPNPPIPLAWPVSVAKRPNQVHIVDFNGDGAADLVFLYGDDEVGVMLANP